MLSAMFLLHFCSICHVVERWLQCKFWADRSPICWSGANATVLWTISMFTTKYHQQSVEYSFPGLDVFWWNHRWTNIQDERSSNWLASYFVGHQALLFCVRFSRNNDRHFSGGMGEWLTYLQYAPGAIVVGTVARFVALTMVATCYVVDSLEA